MRIIITSIFIFIGFNAISQVSIGTINPTEKLDVMGAIAIDHQKTFSNRGQWQITKNIISGTWMDITPNNFPVGSYLCETTFQVSSHHTDNVNFEMRIKISSGQTPNRIQLRTI